MRDKCNLYYCLSKPDINAKRTVEFAVDEFRKYASRMNSGIDMFDVIGMPAYDPNVKNGIWIGLFSELGYITTVINSTFDDEIRICMDNGNGIIAGVNPRSVLLAVYRLLSVAGCRWVRPGKLGESIPVCNICTMKTDMHERPSYRHRGVCIEGAVSYENVAEMIDWLPKVGFNAYFMQFRESYTFFDRWYSHRQNPLLEKESFSLMIARDFLTQIEGEISKRDLIYHAVGHGWTCEPFGTPVLGWENANKEASAEIAQYLALVNGQREFWGGIPVNTNLCYSNPAARKIVVDDVIKYLQEHEKINLLHVWLADGSNNHCECSECSKARPSDYYVMLQNEIDDEMTKHHTDVKIVFLIYVDLLFPPLYERIKNPDRFILMFAPITRVYLEPYALHGSLPPLPPYVRNKVEFPSSTDENIAFLKSWQDIFSGDSFCFDYHLFWDQYIESSRTKILDWGYSGIARVLSEDIKNLIKIGLNGFVSCQVQRAFFPTGLCMYVMSHLLWDKELDYDHIVDEYFMAAFGEDGLICRDYLDSLSCLKNYIVNIAKSCEENTEHAEQIGRTLSVIAKFSPIILRNLEATGNTNMVSSEKACIYESWKFLKIHSVLSNLLVYCLQSHALRQTEAARVLWDSIIRYVRFHEMDVQPVFDVFEFINTFDAMFN